MAAELLDRFAKKNFEMFVKRLPIVPTMDMIFYQLLAML